MKPLPADIQKAIEEKYLMSEERLAAEFGARLVLEKLRRTREKDLPEHAMNRDNDEYNHGRSDVRKEVKL